MVKHSRNKTSKSPTVRFYPCSHCSVVFVDFCARNQHYSDRHPTAALPSDFLQIEPSLIVTHQEREDTSESLFDKHFHSNQSSSGLLASSSKKSKAKRGLRKKAKNAQLSTPPVPSSSTTTMNKMPANSTQQFISLQNVQFVGPNGQPVPTSVATTNGHQQQNQQQMTRIGVSAGSGNANNNNHNTMQGSGKVAFMPISDGSNMLPITMTQIMNGTPIYANIGNGQQPIQFVQVCPGPLQIMDSGPQLTVSNTIGTHKKLKVKNIKKKIDPNNQNNPLNVTTKTAEEIAKAEKKAAKLAENMAKKYSCVECNKYFSTIYNKRRHIVMFHNQGNGTPATVAEASGSAGSINSPSSTQYRCEVCDKGFPNLFNLNRHENVHKPISERLRYKCEMVDCKRRFTTLFILKTHLRKIHNIEPNF